MSWKNNFAKGRELTFVTSSEKNVPNANIVMSLGFVEDKLLIADCQMKNSIKNLKENQNVCVLEGYIRLTGTAEIFTDGKYFDLCVNNNKDFKVNHAIIITIKNVFDLDKVESISY